MAVFLIRAFEGRLVEVALPAETNADAVPDYDENENFNDFWDESFGEFIMGDYSYTASEILFGLDAQAYRAECKTFNESEEISPGEDA